MIKLYEGQWVSVFLAWYDGWVGYYWDRVDRRLYVALLPCVVAVFGRRGPCTQERPPGPEIPRTCDKCGADMEPLSEDRGTWECPDCGYELPPAPDTLRSAPGSP